MNTFYKTAVENLGIEQNTCYELSTVGIEDPVESAIYKFSSHPSILKIKEMVKSTEQFSFTNVDTEQIEIEIKKLNVK